jgi:hypothetical protein
MLHLLFTQMVRTLNVWAFVPSVFSFSTLTDAVLSVCYTSRSDFVWMGLKIRESTCEIIDLLSHQSLRFCHCYLPSMASRSKI